MNGLGGQRKPTDPRIRSPPPICFRTAAEKVAERHTKGEIFLEESRPHEYAVHLRYQRTHRQTSNDHTSSEANTVVARAGYASIENIPDHSCALRWLHTCVCRLRHSHLQEAAMKAPHSNQCTPTECSSKPTYVQNPLARNATPNANVDTWSKPRPYQVHSKQRSGIQATHPTEIASAIIPAVLHFRRRHTCVHPNTSCTKLPTRISPLTFNFEHPHRKRTTTHSPREKAPVELRMLGHPVPNSSLFLPYPTRVKNSPEAKTGVTS